MSSSSDHPKISKEGHRPHPLRGSCRPGTRTVPSSGGLPWTDTFSDLFMVEKSFFNNVTDGFEFHYKCADLNFKDNLASDFWISDLWFLGQTAMQMKFAK